MRMKYHNKTVYADGYKFDSDAERGYYYILKDRQAKGEIRDLQMQVPYVLVPAVYGTKIKHLKTKDKEVSYCTQKAIRYYADFVYTEIVTGEQKVIDVKSDITRMNQVYKLKKKMMFAFHSISIVEVTRDKRGQYIVH